MEQNCLNLIIQLNNIFSIFFWHVFVEFFFLNFIPRTFTDSLSRIGTLGCPSFLLVLLVTNIRKNLGCQPVCLKFVLVVFILIGNLVVRHPKLLLLDFSTFFYLLPVIIWVFLHRWYQHFFGFKFFFEKI